jgi:asparagine synthase (glutamine-hydrolysing)
MCGFLGQLGFDTSCFYDKYVETQIKPILNHRGPDNFSYFKNDKLKIFFAHWRLSIIDLTNSSNQPIKSFSERYMMIFNGEIYNYQSLSKLLDKKKIKYNQNSDSSILVNLFEGYDLEYILNSIEGMYAFAVFDNQEKKLILCRDSFGEKPLYYYSTNNGIIFSSEIKGILKLLKKDQINLSVKGINKYIDYGYFTGNRTVYENIFSVSPGSYKVINNYDFNKIKSFKYFNDQNLTYGTNLSSKNLNDSVNEFDHILANVVDKTLVSDVPIGLFLSGGIDSALIGHYASKKIPDIKTFTVSFDDVNYDESERAKKISEYLGLKNYDIKFKSSDFLRVLNESHNFFDQPFSDSSFIPMFLLSKVASQEVKVCLGGDGADEIFYGYEKKYNFYKKIRLIPKFTKKITHYFDKNNFFFKGKLKTFTNYMKYDIKKLPILLNKKTYLRSFCQIESSDYLDDEQLQYNDFVRDIKYFDIQNYLNSNILYKIDFSTMKNSLELRSPYLDKNIYSFSNKYNHYLFNNNKIFNKNLFLKKFKNFDVTPKKGFSIPLNSYLRKDMNAWMNDIIHSKNNDSLELFDKKRLISFINDKKTNLADIWPILIYMYWEIER